MTVGDDSSDPKNNLGRSDLPTFSFDRAFAIQTDDGGLAWTGRLAWGAQSPALIHEAMERAGDSGSACRDRG